MATQCPRCRTENPEDSKFCKECASSLPSIQDPPQTKTLETPPHELIRGSMFAGRYEIIEELGKGGMGKVYRVEDKKIKQEIALKLIKPEIASDKKTIERFKNELKTARNIRHKSVCGMYDLGEDKGRHYITMEYVSGGDLKKFIKRAAPLSTARTVKIVKQVCEGLAEAHGLGIVHRDLKSNNIMIDDNGNVRIMDFGIARPVKGKGITGSGVMIGTPEYMSPEQVEAKDVDQRSDIYSLGIILYEMTTGRLPFEADTPFAVGIKQKSERPKDPQELNSHIPENLNRIILRCLEKDKERRYQGAGELLSDMERIEQGLPTTERYVPKRKSITSREITVSFNVKKYLIPVFFCIAAAAAAVLILQPWTKKTSIPSLTDKTSMAVLYFKNNTGDERLDIWRTALSDSIITDLSQSKYFEVLTSDRLYSILRKLNLLEEENYASEDLRGVAVEGGVNHVLMGNLSRAGDIFRIEYGIQEIPSGKIRGSNRVEGKGEESLFSLVDQITKEIKREFNLSREQIEEDVDREIGTITTGSIEAFRYYSQGRKSHNVGEYEKSIALMERAIASDPEFAMAYRSMAMAYGNIRLFAKRDENLRKAYELSHRLPDREKYTIEGDFFRRSQNTYDKAIAAYEKLLELYPYDRIGSNNLAIIYSDLEMWDKAIERYKIAIGQKDPSVHGFTGLASVYRNVGRYEDTRDVLLDYLENIQDNGGIRRGLASTYLIQRKFDLALEEIDRAYFLDPTNPACLWIRGHIFIFKGDLEAAKIPFKQLAEREIPVDKVIGILGMLLIDTLQGKFSSTVAYYQQAIDICQSFGQKVWEVNFRLKLGDIYLYLGRLKEALGEYDLAWQIAVDTGALRKQWTLQVDKGVYYLKNHSVPEALETARELKESIESGLYEKAMREHDYLTALIEYEKRNYSTALAHLQKAKNLCPAENDPWDAQAKFSFALGQAYFKKGDLDDAQAAFEEILPMTYGRLFFPELYVLAYYELGKVFQDQGNAARAAEHFEKFLGLWKDADPGLPEVEDARKRLSMLKGDE